MGWNHIPSFESDLLEPDKSNNPWKGKAPKRPARNSVAMPQDDWLRQKLEKLNTVVAEGYPSCAQDSAGLKRDQFIKVPKTQSRWYQIDTIRTEGPHRPGKSLLSWHNIEAKVNSQFPRIVKASAYHSTDPPSRPISQEYLCRWEKSENSYIVNHAAGLNRCTSELQDHMNSHISMLCSHINKVKAPKEDLEALTNLKDRMAFHKNVSVAMDTAIQHLADSIFVNMANLTLLHRDSYLENVKQGIKPDTLNQLRTAPLFSDAVIRTAEQDIAHFETTGHAQRPGPGALQQPSWRSFHRYRPYDKKEHKSASSGDQEQQAWRQFSRPRGRGHSRSGHVATSILNDNYRKVCPMAVNIRFDKKVYPNQIVNSSLLDSLIVSRDSQFKVPQDVLCPVVDNVLSVQCLGHPQKEDLSPIVLENKIKDVKGISCVNHCVSVPHVQSVSSVAPSLAVGGRLQRFGQKWLDLGANPRVVSSLRAAYTLPQGHQWF